MTKWFNTNYHYIVPELSADLVNKSDVEIDVKNLLEQFNDAQQVSDNRKVVLIGPYYLLTFKCYQ